MHKSTKHFGISFAYDAPKIWNDLSDDVHLATSLHSFRNLKAISLHKHIHPNFCFSWYLSVALTPAMSMVNDYSFLLFCLVCLESVFRWRLSATKILLELKLELCYILLLLDIILCQWAPLWMKLKKMRITWNNKTTTKQCPRHLNIHLE